MLSRWTAATLVLVSAGVLPPTQNVPVPADLVLRNARILTVDERFSTASALAIRTGDAEAAAVLLAARHRHAEPLGYAGRALHRTCAAAARAGVDEWNGDASAASARGAAMTIDEMANYTIAVANDGR